MDQRERIENEARRLAEPVLAEVGTELVDIECKREPGGMVVRIYIDKPQGVSLDDCTVASRKLEPVFETYLDALIPGPYNLEVSSPGLFRPLKRPRDFERAVGQRIKVRTVSPVEGQKSFVGILERAGEGHIFLRAGGVIWEIDAANIAKANLEPELKF